MKIISIKTVVILGAIWLFCSAAVMAKEQEANIPKRQEYLEKLKSILEIKPQSAKGKSLLEHKWVFKSEANLHAWERWLEDSKALPPDFDSMPSVPDLPDPFVMNDGTKVETKEQWEKRRQELKEHFQNWVFGHFPPAPGNTRAVEVKPFGRGAGLDKNLWQVQFLRLEFGPDHKAGIRTWVATPLDKKPPYPAIITWDNPYSECWMDLNEAHRRGYVVCGYIDEDCHKLAEFYPDYDWGTIARQAFGAHRCVDYLCSSDKIRHDQIAVIDDLECCFGYVAAAFDERIALCANFVWYGSAIAPFRYKSERFYEVGSIWDRTITYYRKYAPQLRFFAGREDRLPVDLHELLALIAPRPCLVVGRSRRIHQDASAWAYERAYLAAKKVYDFLGAGDRLGLRLSGYPGVQREFEPVFIWSDRWFGKLKLDEDYTKVFSEMYSRLLFPYTFGRWQELTKEKAPDLSKYGEKGISDLLQADGKAIASTQDWEKKRADIRSRILSILGPFPATEKSTLDAKVALSPTKGNSSLTGRSGKIRVFTVQGDGISCKVRMPAEAKGKKPAVICLHEYSYNWGGEIVDGTWEGCLGGHEIAIDLAERGYISLCYDQIGFGERWREGDLNFYKENPNLSVLGRMIWDVQKAVDILCKLDEVDSEKIVCQGFSLGGKVALYAAAFDERIKGVVSSCGFTPLRTGASQWESAGVKSYSHWMGLAPRLGFFVGHEKKIPYDYHEVLALIAPRPILVISPQLDPYDDRAGVKICCEEAQKAYKLLGVDKNMRLLEPWDYHRFSEEVQYKAVFDWLQEIFPLAQALPQLEEMLLK